jgi:hypothetical protein
MFCPKCGAENPETNQYCRACRESLQVISQAMKSRLPVVIASKVDQILDSRSERFRRDSLLNLLMSLTTLFGGLISWLKGYSGPFSAPLFFLPLALVWAWDAAREYRAYKRSLSPDFDWIGSDEELRYSLAHREKRLDARSLSPDSDWRGTGQADYRDSLAYRLGTFVGKFFSSRRNLGTVAPAQFATVDNLPNYGGTRSSSYADAPPPSVTESTTRQLGLIATDRKEASNKAASATYSAHAFQPSVTESTTRDLNSLGTAPKEQPRIIYCAICGRPSDRPVSSCPICGANLDLIAKALEPPKQNSRTVNLDRFIRGRTNRLAWSEDYSLLMSCMLVALVLLVGAWSSWSTPGWWYSLSLSVIFLVAHVWDRIAYRRISPEQRSTLLISESALPKVNATPPVIDADWKVFSEVGRVLRIDDSAPAMIDATESKPIREWQRLYPDLWLLIEVSSEDEWGVSKGKLVATAEDRVAFQGLDESYDELFLIAIHGRH